MHESRINLTLERSFFQTVYSSRIFIGKEFHPIKMNFDMRTPWSWIDMSNCNISDHSHHTTHVASYCKAMD